MALLLGAYGDLDDAAWDALTGELGDPTSLAEWKVGCSTTRLARARGRAPQGVATKDHLAAVATGRIGSGTREASELVLETYARAGIADLPRLRGEHTYFLWDGLRRELIVGCAIGARAPAYIWDGRTMVVCSRALPLLRVSSGWRCWDDVYVAHVLSGLWAPATSTTAFRGIRRLMAGEILRVSVRGLERFSRDTLDFPPQGAALGRDRVVHELAERIDRAVQARLNGSGRACVALSGGLDSCVVASAVARCTPGFDAFRLTAHEPSAPTPVSVQPVFPAMREHWVSIPATVGFEVSATLADDTIAAGPAQQPGRVALLRAMCDAGFERVLDGEGGDELFDLAWRLGDLGEKPRSMATVRVLLHRSSGRRFLRDQLARGVLGQVSDEWLRRQRSRMAARRPWLRSSFWEGHAFGAAWEEAIDFGRARHARDRLGPILEAHARYRAVQDLARDTFGIAAESPLLDRDVIEFVGSLPARFAIEPGHSKALLRRLALTRLPAAIAWRPKQEPLYEWLAARAVCDEARVDRITGAVATRALLADIVDPLAVRAAVDSVRHAPERATSTATALDQLFWFVEWSGAVHARYGIG